MNNGIRIAVKNSRRGKAKAKDETEESPPAQLKILRSTEKPSDAIVKEEIYNELVAEGYKPSVVFDDRTKVIKMWRRLGLTVFDVGDGEDF